MHSFIMYSVLDVSDLHGYIHIANESRGKASLARSLCTFHTHITDST